MSRATFIKALELAENFGYFISIGGGEPTLHKYFWDFIGLALSRAEESSVWLATNGSQTADAIRLSNLALRGVLSVELSLDQFHDPIDPRVIEAFTRKYINYNGGDKRGVRSVELIANIGRAKKNGVATIDGKCPCDDLLIAPDGKIWTCGCKSKSLGTVFDPKFPDDNDFLDSYCINYL